jgi:Spy/CpxP family protein refolding chaperone
VRKRNFLVAVSVLGALILIFSLAQAQMPRSGFAEKADKLSLTDEQMESMREVGYNFEKTAIGLRAELKTSRLELRHLMMQEKPNQKEIDGVVDRIGETQKKLLKNNVDRKLAMKGILTQEQFEKFMKNRGERGKRRMGKGEGFRQQRPGGFCPFGDGSGL